MERIKEATSKTFDRLNLPLPPLEGREGAADTELTRAGLVNDPSVPPSVHPLIPEKTQDILQTVLRRYRMWAFPPKKGCPRLKVCKKLRLILQRGALKHSPLLFYPLSFLRDAPLLFFPFL
jgi:hypothetical protein